MMHPWLLYFTDNELEASFPVSRWEPSFYPTVMMGVSTMLVLALSGMVATQQRLLVIPAFAAVLLFTIARCTLTLQLDQARACWLYRMLTLVALPFMTAAVGMIQRMWPQPEMQALAFILMSGIYSCHSLTARLDHTPYVTRWMACVVNWQVWLAFVPALSDLGHSVETLVVVAHTLLGEAAGFPLERQLRLAYLHSRTTAETEQRAREAERLALELRVKLDAQAEVLSAARSIRRDLGLAHLPREIAFASLSIKQKLGSGGFGIVYRASCAHADGTTTEVALKLPSRVCSKRDLERFEREISTMEALQHPNIVRIVGSVWRPSIMLVLEWMPGGSLHVVLAQGGKVEPERAALDVASGMAYLHELRFCHRDLKAANILLTNDGTAKIGDFGLTSQVDAYSTLKSNAGTPLWSAPEVQVGTRAYDERCDIYSFAILLLEIEDFLCARAALPACLHACMHALRSAVACLLLLAPSDAPRRVARALSRSSVWA